MALAEQPSLEVLIPVEWRHERVPVQTFSRLTDACDALPKLRDGLVQSWALPVMCHLESAARIAMLRARLTKSLSLGFSRVEHRADAEKRDFLR